MSATVTNEWLEERTRWLGLSRTDNEQCAALCELLARRKADEGAWTVKGGITQQTMMELNGVTTPRGALVVHVIPQEKANIRVTVTIRKEGA